MASHRLRRRVDLDRRVPNGKKFLEVRRAVERDPRPFVWIDDDLDFFQDGPVTARDWAASLPLPSLLIASEGETGLLPQQLDAVEDFVRRHGGGVQEHETGET